MSIPRGSKAGDCGFCEGTMIVIGSSASALGVCTDYPVECNECGHEELMSESEIIESRKAE